MNKLLILAFTLAASFNVAASQNVTVLTNLDGMTLYIFDKDSPNNSHCYDACAASWPPYLVTSADAARPGWGVTMREDGNAQHTFQGKPLYLWVGDQHAGDQTGDGVGGVWHTATKKAKTGYSQSGSGYSGY